MQSWQIRYKNLRGDDNQMYQYGVANIVYVNGNIQPNSLWFICCLIYSAKGDAIFNFPP